MSKSSIEQFYAEQASRSASRMGGIALTVSVIGFLPVVSIAVSMINRRSSPGEVQGGLDALSALLSIALLGVTSIVGLSLALYARRESTSRIARAAIALGGLGIALVLFVAAATFVG